MNLGGKARTSEGDVSEVDNNHRKGNRKMMAPAINKR
jgi:hypothetical protein